MPPEPAPAPEPRHDPWAALRSRDFRLLMVASFLAVVGEQLVGVALGWELYDRTGSPLALGFVGLVQVVPVLALALPAGHVADRADRRRIVILCLVILGLGSAGLALLSSLRGPLWLVYGCLFAIGVGRAFERPAFSALLAGCVPPEHFTSAATWSSSSWQAASIVGPALGGALVAWAGRAAPVYAVDAALALALAGLVAAVRARPKAAAPDEPLTLASLSSGLRFVFQTRILLAAITLDLFAVLLGGATALLPIYASRILHVGAAGLGWLRAAPAIGAIAAGLVVAHRPPFRRAGWTLLVAVAGFGAATIVFGVSKSFPLSLAMLALLGAFDNVSVVIRTTLELTRTPDALRGRVNAVHGVFIGLSSELGAFESGVAAQLLGTVGAVAFGGAGTLVVVALVALLWPEVRRLRRLTD